MSEHKKIIIDIPIRFRDIDFMGHVNNVVFLTYFEEGRKEFLHALFGIDNPENYNFILAHLSCDYLKPIRLNDTVSLEIWVGKIGRKSFNFNYLLVGKTDMDGKPTLYAKGQSIQVYFDYKKNTALQVPEHFRKKISEYCSQD